MKKFTFTPTTARVCVALLFSGILSGPISPAAVANPITLDTGNGETAVLSNYSLTNYGEPSPGNFRGRFCFTLANTSATSPPRLPVYVVGVGILVNGGMPEFLTDYEAPGGFVESLSSIIEGSNLNLDVLVTARNAPGAGGGYGGIYGPTDGVAFGASANFCLGISSSQPFSLDQLIERTVIVFSDEVGGCYVSNSIGPAGLPSVAALNVDTFGDAEITLRMTNVDETSGSGWKVSGAAIDVPGGSGGYSLATESITQLGSFKYVTDPKKLRKAGDDVDFGTLSPPGKGLGFFQSVSFRVLGNFAGQTPAAILQAARVRFDGEWGQFSPTCPGSDPTGNGVRGTVATVPR